MKLGVNIDHVATLRQARYAADIHAHNAEPSLLAAAAACERAGAHGITIHLRADRRHIQDADVWELRQSTTTRLNFEMGNTAEILEIALQLKPNEVCLVPENRAEITTEGGMDVSGQLEALSPTVERLHAAGIRVSMFIEPDAQQIEASRILKAEMVELHTGAFANAQGESQLRELARLQRAAGQAHLLGLQVNAGHGINYENIARIREVPHLAELNIGHSIIARALVVGMEQAVKDMLAGMAEMNILGLGVDIVEIARLRTAIERQGKPLLDRCFSTAEQAYCASHRDPAPFYAARFAAKEAVAKALGTGIGSALTWLDMEVSNNEAGAPLMTLSGAGAETARRLGVQSVMISLSHSEHYAVANAIAVGA